MQPTLCRYTEEELQKEVEEFFNKEMAHRMRPGMEVTGGEKGGG